MQCWNLSMSDKSEPPAGPKGPDPHAADPNAMKPHGPKPVALEGRMTAASQAQGAVATGIAGELGSGGASNQFRGVSARGRVAGEENIAVGSATGSSTPTAIGGSITEATGSTFSSEAPDIAHIRGDVGRSRTAIIITAVRSNQAALQLSGLSLLASLDAKLELIRSERSNSEEAARYEDLKRRVEQFLSASSSKDDVPIAETALSLADGLRDWWDKDHVNICTKALNIGLFAGGLSMCAAAGVLGPLSVVTVGTLIVGKQFTRALEASAKLLKSPD
jgi:hypothetical protein